MARTSLSGRNDELVAEFQLGEWEKSEAELEWKLAERFEHRCAKCGRTVRALPGHSRLDTTQIYTSIKPARLKRAVGFYEEKAVRMLSE